MVTKKNVISTLLSNLVALGDVAVVLFQVESVCGNVGGMLESSGID